MERYKKLHLFDTKPHKKNECPFCNGLGYTIPKKDGYQAEGCKHCESEGYVD